MNANPSVEQSGVSQYAKSQWVLWMSTIAFTLCFSVWTLYSILAIKIQDEIGLTASQFGTLLAIPILVGSLTRVPFGMLTDRYGGRVVFTALLAITAIPTYALSFAKTYSDFLWCGAGFGLAGAGFAVGIAYVSVWTPKDKQGTALGIFGVGNVGSAITTFAVPFLIVAVSSWRTVPVIYAGLLIAMAIIFYLTTYDDADHHREGLTLAQRLAPFKKIRVWRFGLYYFLVFGGFVALGLWLPNYYRTVYGLSLEEIALITMAFLLPASFIRAFGGWLSDKFGARKVMIAVLWTSIVSAGLLSIPPCEMTLLTMPYSYQAQSTGDRVQYTLAFNKFRKTTVAKVVSIGAIKGEEAIASARGANPALDQELKSFLDQVAKGSLSPEFTRRTLPIAIDVWVFTVLVFILGVALGIGKAAVYRYIPDYFPKDIGAVGGVVGLIGGLGGFFLPILWGYFLEWTGVAASAYFFLFILSVVCLAWLRYVVVHFMIPRSAAYQTAIEEPVK